MTDQQFIDTWRGEVTGWWAENGPRPLFWARAYNMDPHDLVEMSGDFLLLDNIPDCSSKSMAMAVWGHARMRGNQ